jgi:hypothetical protein
MPETGWMKYTSAAVPNYVLPWIDCGTLGQAIKIFLSHGTLEQTMEDCNFVGTPGHYNREESFGLILTLTLNE